MDKSQVAAMVQETNKALDKVSEPSIKTRLSSLEQTVAKLATLVDGNNAALERRASSDRYLLDRIEILHVDLGERLTRISGLVEVQVPKKKGS